MFSLFTLPKSEKGQGLFAYVLFLLFIVMVVLVIVRVIHPAVPVP